MPTKVGGEGIEKILEVPFSREEMKGLRNSADTLKELVKTHGDGIVTGYVRYKKRNKAEFKIHSCSKEYEQQHT